MASILVIYTISVSKNNNYENQLIAGNYYLKLKSIVEKIKVKIIFFSNSINEFINRFYNLNDKLLKLGYKLTKNWQFESGKNDDNFIIFPNKLIRVKIIGQLKNIQFLRINLN